MASTDYVRDVVMTLEAACARNQSVEIRCESSGTLQVAQSRLLAVDDTAAYLDSPQHDGRGVRFAEQAVVDIHLSADEGGQMFRSRVTQSVCEIKLNSVKTVIGMAVSLPAQLEQTQRRESFRVSLTDLEPIVAKLHVASRSDPNCCPLNTERFVGLIADLSAGGLALRVDGSQRRSFRVREHYFVSYALPDGHGEMTCLVEVRHIHAILDEEVTRLGVQFISWNEPNTKLNVDRMRQFGTELRSRGVQSG